MRCCNDAESRVRPQRLDEAIEEGWFDQWFVSLYIQYEIKLRRLAGDLGDSVSPAVMTLRRHRYLGAPIESGFGDAHVVCGDDQGIQSLRATAAFPHVPEKGFVCNGMQWF